MDLASLIGLIGAVGMIVGAMLSGGGLGAFIDVASILIVFGGTFFAVMYTAPLGTFLGSFGAMSKAFLPPVKKPDVMIERMIELAAIARKDGMMALEGQAVPDKFFEKGLQIQEVARISGHKDWKQLLRYTQLNASSLVDKLNS